MSILICGCGRRFAVPPGSTDAAACPACGSIVPLPAVAPGAAAVPAPAAPSGTAATETKACPYCAEQILVNARKCRNCGEFLDARLRSANKAQSLVWRDDALLLRRGGPLPSTHCAMCVQDAESYLRKSYVQRPSWVYLTILLGLLPFVVIALVLRKEAVVSIPLCRKCKQAWRAADMIMILVGSLSMIGLPILGGIVGNSMARDGWILGGITGVALAFVTLIILRQWVNRRQVTSGGIDDTYVSLRFPHCQALKEAWAEAGVTNMPAGGSRSLVHGPRRPLRRPPR